MSSLALSGAYKNGRRSAVRGPPLLERGRAARSGLGEGLLFQTQRPEAAPTL